MKKKVFKIGVLVVGLGLLALGASSCVAYRYHYYPDEGYRGWDSYWFVPFPFFYYGDHHRPPYHRPPHRYDGPPPDRRGSRGHPPPDRFGPGTRPPR